MHALVRFAPIAAGSSFTTVELYGPVIGCSGPDPSEYSLASFRYELRLCGLRCQTAAADGVIRGADGKQ
jgi:hypothetical protein